MATSIIKMKTHFKTVRYGFLENGGCYELLSEDALPLISNKRAELISSTEFAPLEKIVTSGQNEYMNRLEKTRKEKTILIQTNVKGKEDREAEIKKLNHVIDEQLEEAESIFDVRREGKEDDKTETEQKQKTKSKTGLRRKSKKRKNKKEKEKTILKEG